MNIHININIYIYVNIKNSYIHTYIYTLAAPAATFRDDLPRNPKGLIGCEYKSTGGKPKCRGDSVWDWVCLGDNKHTQTY